jgi:hypothetical protein
MAKKGKKGGSSGQRGKKKHAKELKRKNKLAGSVSHTPAAARAWDPQKEGIERFARRLHAPYYTLAHEIEDHASAPLDQLPSVVWTPQRIAALSTSELLTRLGAVGITTTEEAFVAATAQERSALRFARRAWLPVLRDGSSVHDHDLALLGACALWQRLRPATPSLEGILDPYLDGIAQALSNEPRAALEAWLQFFDRLRTLFTPEIRTIADIEALFDGEIDDIQFLTEDLFELARELDPRPEDLTRRVAAALGVIAEQLSGEDPRWWREVIHGQASLLAGINDLAGGEALLRATIARHPARLEARVALVDYLLDNEGDENGGVKQAIAVLEEAKASGAVPEHHREIDNRIDELREFHLED